MGVKLRQGLEKLSLKSIPGGLKYFPYLGHPACVVTPATLGFHLIKRLASVPQGVKTSREFQCCDSIWYLSPHHGKGASWVVFMTRRPPEAQNANNTTAAECRPMSSISYCSSVCQSCHWCQHSGSQSDSATQDRPFKRM